jgi:UDP-N-acetylglucosamine 2-epimerase (non-hydrolysing)
MGNIGGTMLTLVYGTRPEAIKLGPVVAALRARQVPHRILCTDQHGDLLHGTPAQTDLLESVSLGLRATGDIVRWSRQAAGPLREALEGATLVVVQGDTLSPWAGAQAAHALGIPVAHIEAGVRSGDLQDPWPEESLRREITGWATWHYPATAWAYANLAAEGITADRMTITGNSVVSALARYAGVSHVSVPDLQIVFTMHRREWRLGGILDVLRGFHAAAATYPEVEITWPIHPAVAREVTPSWLDGLPPNAKVIPPLAYRPMIRLLAKSLGVITDSGGLQEEAATLGVPCIVARRVTDRPESVEAGVAKLCAPTGVGVEQAFRWVRDRVIPRRPVGVFGDAGAADRIAAHLAQISQSAERIASTSS